jgi:hypothetical protein
MQDPTTACPGCGGYARSMSWEGKLFPDYCAHCLERKLGIDDDLFGVSTPSVCASGPDGLLSPTRLGIDAKEVAG